MPCIMYRVLVVRVLCYFFASNDVGLNNTQLL